MKKVLMLLLAITASQYVQAGQITFNWTADQTNTELLSGSGFWTIDESAIVPSTGINYAPVVTAFGFNWTTNLGPVTLDSSNGYLNEAYMSFDSQNQLLGFTICASAVVGPCGLSVNPSFQMIALVGWGASTGDNQQFSVVFGNPTVTQTVSGVPEPGLLALVTLGLLLLAGTHSGRHVCRRDEIAARA
ncbi:MAG: hypothetical protein R3E64_14840 [Halioglobus sp.]